MCVWIYGRRTNGQLSGVIVENVNCSGGGTGIKVGGGVNVRFINTTVMNCTVGMALIDTGERFQPNVYQWDNCTSRRTRRMGLFGHGAGSAAVHVLRIPIQCGPGSIPPVPVLPR